MNSDNESTGQQENGATSSLSPSPAMKTILPSAEHYNVDHAEVTRDGLHLRVEGPYVNLSQSMDEIDRLEIRNIPGIFTYARHTCLIVYRNNDRDLFFVETRTLKRSREVYALRKTNEAYKYAYTPAAISVFVSNRSDYFHENAKKLHLIAKAIGYCFFDILFYMFLSMPFVLAYFDIYVEHDRLDMYDRIAITTCTISAIYFFWKTKFDHSSFIQGLSRLQIRQKYV
ncbi:MAG: hypothetical protein AAFX39_12560 [Pseudomonadota bacterium]